MHTKPSAFLFAGLLGLICLAMFKVLGSSIDANGILKEPFFLLPTGYVLTVLGFGGFLVKFLLRTIR